MFDLTLQDNDRRWLMVNHPSLKIRKKDNGVTEIVGDLRFNMSFLGEEEPYPYVLDPAPGDSRGVKIQDKYQIRVELIGSDVSNLPQVYETGSRIERVAQEKSLKLVDLHVNPNGSMCLCLSFEESEKLPNGYSLEKFFNLLVIPFFYAQSYFNKDNTSPWGYYSHGALGFIEWYLKQDNTTKQMTEDLLARLRKYDEEWQLFRKWLVPKYKVKGHHQCLCLKNEKFRNCHRDVLHGIWKLKQGIAEFNIKYDYNVFPDQNT